jgi:hypothetical protein
LTPVGRAEQWPPSVSPEQMRRDAEERERLRARAASVSEGLAGRANALRSSAASLAQEVHSLSVELERLAEMSERLGELG